MKLNREQAKQYFHRDTEQHQMQVLRDDGVYRHLLFKKPGTGSYHFNIITYPGTLVYTGGMGSFVFQRLDDMFQFFRTDSDWGDGINPGYWAEKLVAVDRHGHKEFQEGEFDREIMSRLTQWIREYRDRTSREERRELWEAVVSSVIEADGDNDGMRKQIAANNFQHRVTLKDRRSYNFHFVDLWESSFEDYSLQFYWCCYALAWAVKQYDQAKLEAKGQQEASNYHVRVRAEGKADQGLLAQAIQALPKDNQTCTFQFPSDRKLEREMER